MSAETKAALEAAVKAHVSDEAEDGTRFVTDWYCITHAVGEEEDASYYLHVSSNSSTHVLWGLANIVQRRMAAYFEDPDSDI